MSAPGRGHGSTEALCQVADRFVGRILDQPIEPPAAMSRMPRITPVVALLGLPGAGKGTQAQRLQQPLGIAHLSVGELFRMLMASGDADGVSLRRFVSQGLLVPDTLVVRLVSERMREIGPATAIVLDGFPRTLAQALAFDAMADTSPTVAAFVDVPEATLVRRLAGRRTCEAQGHVFDAEAVRPMQPDRCDVDGSRLYTRGDDEPDLIASRICAQATQLDEILAHYRSTDRLAVVDGSLPVDQVAVQIEAIVSGVISKPAIDVRSWVHPSRGWILGMLSSDEHS